MPRPNKLLVPAKTYNLTLPIEDWDRLAKHSHIQTQRYGIQISVADLMRSAITLYIADLDQEELEYEQKKHTA
jgi:extradiol dioxygenase family protein